MLSLLSGHRTHLVQGLYQVNAKKSGEGVKIIDGGEFPDVRCTRINGMKKAGAANSTGFGDDSKNTRMYYLTRCFPSIIRAGGPSQTPFNRRLK